MGSLKVSARRKSTKSKVHLSTAESVKLNPRKTCTSQKPEGPPEVGESRGLDGGSAPENLQLQDFSVGKLRRERNKKAKKLATVVDLLESTLKIDSQPQLGELEDTSYEIPICKPQLHKAELESVSASPPAPLETGGSQNEALQLNTPRVNKHDIAQAHDITDDGPFEGVGSQNGALQLSKPGKHDIAKALEITGDGPSCVGARRPQRVRKENTWYAGGNYQSTLSAEYDWVIFYPDTPYDSNTQVIDALGNVVSVTGQLECCQQGNSALGEVVTFSSGSSESLADAAWVPRTSRKDRKDSPQVSENLENSSIDETGHGNQEEGDGSKEASPMHDDQLVVAPQTPQNLQKRKRVLENELCLPPKAHKGILEKDVGESFGNATPPEAIPSSVYTLSITSRHPSPIQLTSYCQKGITEVLVDSSKASHLTRVFYQRHFATSRPGRVLFCVSSSQEPLRTKAVSLYIGSSKSSQCSRTKITTVDPRDMLTVPFPPASLDTGFISNHHSHSQQLTAGKNGKTCLPDERGSLEDDNRSFKATDISTSNPSMGENIVSSSNRQRIFPVSQHPPQNFLEKLPRKGQTKVRRKKFHPKVQVERVPKERRTETPLKAKTPKTPRKAKPPHHEGNDDVAYDFKVQDPTHADSSALPKKARTEEGPIATQVSLPISIQGPQSPTLLQLHKLMRKPRLGKRQNRGEAAMLEILRPYISTDSSVKKNEFFKTRKVMKGMAPDTPLSKKPPQRELSAQPVDYSGEAAAAWRDLREKFRLDKSRPAPSPTTIDVVHGKSTCPSTAWERKIMEMTETRGMRETHMNEACEICKVLWQSSSLDEDLCLSTFTSDDANESVETLCPCLDHATDACEREFSRLSLDSAEDLSAISIHSKHFELQVQSSFFSEADSLDEQVLTRCKSTPDLSPPLQICTHDSNSEKTAELCDLLNPAEDPPSTPRGNVTNFPESENSMDSPPASPASPASPRSCLFQEDSSTSSGSGLNVQGGSTKEPCRRPAKLVRRCLLSDFNPMKALAVSTPIPAAIDATCKSLILEHPVPFLKMNELQQEQCDSALVEEDKYMKKRANLVKAMTRNITEDDSPEMAVHSTDLALNVTDKDYNIPKIDRDSPELQIVTYKGEERKMVMYQEPVKWRRRVRYKPKVSLDSDTVKMFKRLMIKGGAVDDDQQDEASWEKSRQEWRIRAHHFISIMRHVQGDRTFSRWGGSVMDSIGGAFLTQNVSDYLSSTAFMSLRARFPARREAAEEEETPNSAEEQPVAVQETPHPLATRPTRDELKKKQLDIDLKYEEVSNKVCTVLHSDDSVDISTDTAIREIVDELLLKLDEISIESQGEKTLDLAGSPLVAKGRQNEFATSIPRRISEETLEEPVKKTLDDSLQAPTLNICTVEENSEHQVDVVGNGGGTVRPLQDSGSSSEVIFLLHLLEEFSEKKTPKPFAVTQPEEPVVPQAVSKHNDLPLEIPIQRLMEQCDVEKSSAICDVVKISIEDTGGQVLIPDFVESASKTDCCIVESVPCTTLQENQPQVAMEERAFVEESNSAEVGILGGRNLAENIEAGDSPFSSWDGNLSVIQKKYDYVVEEDLRCLTVVGREKVLAATLRMVLGKLITSREASGEQVKPLVIVNFRSGRKRLRNRINNYRYMNKVSFRLLSGPERAKWEAGYVMKSQKEKWEPLRTKILSDPDYARDPLTVDCVDWDAVRIADVHEVSDVIKDRGMNNVLAGRLKAFIDRVYRDYGSLDLEWIRKLTPHDAKSFLLSARGLGLKSVECIRLLTLHHASFPVDTNVGRIAVRLGWVPLEPLPEETQLHLLELYPIQASIQQYMWPRLCNLDQKTLYELHYQMITFGKVFCTKSKPNCNACPMRSECKHFASSYSSAKLHLKGPEKREDTPLMLELPATDPGSKMDQETRATSLTDRMNISVVTIQPCVPIIEEPSSPDTIIIDVVHDIEDYPFHIQLDDFKEPVQTHDVMIRMPECIGLLELNVEPELPTPDSNNLSAPTWSVMEEKIDPELNVDQPSIGWQLEAMKSTDVIIEDLPNEPVSQIRVDGLVPALIPSQELILLPPQGHISPAPQLKTIQRLRTVHYVYELPDNHPLIAQMDKREADDPCFYLLAIWSPEEVPEKIPNIDDEDACNPFASCQYNEKEQTVRGTLLVPCRTAMKGWFPLNGTYFQVNEVFADHASSVQPLEVPRTLLWALRRRFVYFSTAVTSLFKDMSQQEIQCCFKKGYVCVRAFDQKTRQPKLLATRLHQSGAKIVKAPVPRKPRRSNKCRLFEATDNKEALSNLKTKPLNELPNMPELQLTPD